MATSTRRTALPAGAGDYRLENCFDEAMVAADTPRQPYEELLTAIGRQDLIELGRQVQAEVAARGVTFGPERPVSVDAIPRLIGAEHWEALEAGLLQRARALNAFLADAYGERRIFAAGLVPLALLETSPGYEPLMRGLLDPQLPAAAVAGFDLVRDPSGSLMVLEDNLRMPSGSAYAAAIRDIVAGAIDSATRPRPLGEFFTALAATLRRAAPDGRGDPAIAILSDGPASGAWFEHIRLGRALEAPVVVAAELETERGRLFARQGRERRQIDVVYRRLDEDRLSAADGKLTPIGELLLPALRSRRLRCVNAFGTGVADDKLAHAYVGSMIGFYLGEEPTIPSVATIDLSDAEQRAAAIERLDELVVKPRDGFGGQGVTIMPRASATERRRVIGLLRRRADRFVAQEPVALSSHPTICAGRMRPRRVDLRPFVLSDPAGGSAMSGGLTRFARGAGELIVNSSRGGGCKDTWVVER